MEALTKRNPIAAHKVIKARALLLCDESEHRPGWNDPKLIEATGMKPATLERLRARCCEVGPLQALERKAQSKPSRKPILNDESQARLRALACSQASDGRKRWTLQLLAEEAVELKIVKAISHETVRQQGVFPTRLGMIRRRRFGAPKHIHSDNGPEFIAYALQDWLGAQQIKTLYIKPGSPWEQAYIESFHDNYAMNCSTGNSLATCTKLELFLRLGGATIITNARTVPWDIKVPPSYAASCKIPHLATPKAPFRSDNTNSLQNSTFEVSSFWDEVKERNDARSDRRDSWPWLAQKPGRVSHRRGC